MVDELTQKNKNDLRLAFQKGIEEFCRGELSAYLIKAREEIMKAGERGVGTQEYCAEIIGWHQGTYSRYESNHNDPHWYSKAILVATVLDLDLSRFEIPDQADRIIHGFIKMMAFARLKHGRSGSPPKKQPSEVDVRCLMAISMIDECDFKLWLFWINLDPAKRSSMKSDNPQNYRKIARIIEKIAANYEILIEVDDPFAEVDDGNNVKTITISVNPEEEIFSLAYRDWFHEWAICRSVVTFDFDR